MTGKGGMAAYDRKLGKQWLSATHRLALTVALLPVGVFGLSRLVCQAFAHHLPASESQSTQRKVRPREEIYRHYWRISTSTSSTRSF